jgi:hypothetical protein
MTTRWMFISSSVVLSFFLAATTARAQAPAAADSPWSVDVSVGWDNSISGDFINGAIGTLQGLPLVLEKRTWDDVYGTGVLFNVTAGYDLKELAELRGGFTYQSTGADDTLSIGSYRGGPLTASFDNYSAWALDFGYRRYFAERTERWRPYAAGTIGFGVVRDISADFAQTGTNFSLADADFYEGNGAVTFGVNGGVLYRLSDRLSLDGRLGLRYVSGLSDVDGSAFTNLDDANDGSSRWTLPLTVGVKVRF